MSGQVVGVEGGSEGASVSTEQAAAGPKVTVSQTNGTGILKLRFQQRSKTEEVPKQLLVTPWKPSLEGWQWKSDSSDAVVSSGDPVEHHELTSDGGLLVTFSESGRKDVLAKGGVLTLIDYYR